MNILFTAVGSMSAKCALQSIRKCEGVDVVIGCDIYPANWHYESLLCDLYYQVPFATDEDLYVRALKKICKDNNVDYVFPLTDLEIDVLRRYRCDFVSTLCIPSEYVLNIARDKFNIYSFFLNDKDVNVLKTYKKKELLDKDFVFPLIAKPYNGRSSEGLKLISSKKDLDCVINEANYIYQPFFEGDIYTVDYVRSNEFDEDFSIPRKELLRTKNGAGVTVFIEPNRDLQRTVSVVGKKLKINGCVNFEFISNSGKYYLIDINPRFSAGIGFSEKIGYDFVQSALNCFLHKHIFKAICYDKHILTKSYSEHFIS